MQSLACGMRHREFLHALIVHFRIGSMVKLIPTEVPLDSLLLDPNNFRFKDPGRNSPISESRVEETSVQVAILERIKADGVSELKQSIAENGFVQVERIVVRPFGEPENEHYLVIEGNRRTAALKLLRSDHLGGVDFKANVTDTFDAIPVLVAREATDDDYLAIMGIRHVGGPKEWGGFQSAMLVYQLFEDSALSPRKVASRLGLSVNEVNRRHRAFGALTQMMNDEEHGENVTPEMYPIFHEAVGQPTVREWLGWSQTNREFEDENSRALFYSWLSDGDTGPKIRSYSEVRELKLILENEDALVALKDDNQSFADALAIVRSDAKSARWLPNARSALASLNEMGSDTIEKLTQEEISLLQDLRKRSAWIIKAHSVSSDIENDED